MTVPTESTKGTAAGNDIATVFNLDFDLPARHVENMVLTHVTVAGVESTLVSGVDYTINDATDQFTFPLGGSTYSVLATGEKIVYRLVAPLDQPTDLANQGGFYPETIEEALDDAAFRDQTLQEQVDRAIKIPVGSAIGTTPDDLINLLTTSVAAADASATASANSAAASDASADASAASAALSESFADDAETSAQNAADIYALLLSAFSKFDNDFKLGQFKTGMTLGRAGGGGYTSLSGTYTVDLEPFTETITNYVRNSTFVGGVAGTVGGTGTVPTNLQIVMGAGSTGTMSFGTDGTTGLEYMDLAMTGALTGGGTQLASIYFENLTHITRVQGEPLAFQVMLARPTGGATNITDVHIRNSEIDGSSVAVAESTPVQSSVHSTLNATPVTVKTATPFIMQNAACAAARPWVSVSATTAQVVNFTLRIIAPQAEKRAAGPSNTYVPTSGSDASDDVTYDIPSPNVPRFTYSLRNHKPLGIYVEPAVTNLVRNSRGLNAAASSTLPTNWSNDIAGGITRTVVGTGTIDGIDGVYIRLQGTPGPGGSFYNLYCESNTGCAFVNGETGVFSAYVAMTAGSTAGIDRMYMALLQRDGAGGSLSPALGTTLNQKFMKGVTDGTLVRMDSTGLTASNASTAYLRPQFAFISTNPAAAIDVTIFVGGVQVEKGSFPTSLVPNISTDILATTRPTERALVNDLDDVYFNQTQGMMVIEHIPSGINTASDATVASLHDTTANNRMGIRVKGSDRTGDAAIFTAGVSQASFTGRGNIIANAVNRTILAWENNHFLISTNGGPISTVLSGTVPSVTRLALGDNGYDTNNHYSGTISRLTTYDARATDDAAGAFSRVVAGPVDTIIIIGQSNADGRGDNWKMPDAVHAMYSEALPNLFIYNKPAVYQSSNFSVTAGSFADDGAWWNLAPMYDAARTRTPQVIGGSNGSGVDTQGLGLHGVEMALAQQHQLAHPGRELRIIKAAVNGSFIEDTWKVENADTGGLWDWFKNYVYTPAVADMLAQGKTPNIIGVFWMQGEADTLNSTYANAYGGHLQKLISRLNTELYMVPRKIVIGQLSATYDTGVGPTVKAAQASVAAANPNTALLITDGTGPDAAYALNSDNIHYSAPGLYSMAVRLWTILNS